MCGSEERVGDVRDRVRAAGGWEVCIVVDAEHVVLGLVSSNALGGDPSAPVEDVMERAPTTFRPNLGIAEMPEYLHRHQLPYAVITSSDGILIGLWRREDVGPHPPAGSR